MSEYIIRTTNMPEHVREALSVWYEIDYEIVRCRDCAKYSEQEPNGEIGLCELGFEDTGLYSIVEPDGFCAWGERRN